MGINMEIHMKFVYYRFNIAHIFYTANRKGIYFHWKGMDYGSAIYREVDGDSNLSSIDSTDKLMLDYLHKEYKLQ